MFQPLRILLFATMATLATSGAGHEDLRLPVPASSPPHAGDRNPLSVMTYNVKGLPWPIAMGRDEALDRIAERLVAMRRADRQPHIILLQETFSAEAASLATRAGYRHVAKGPQASLRTPAAVEDGDGQYLQQARWDRGEHVGKPLDSGLMILSDYPIVGAERMAFPDVACAGFDCLANKGVLMAHLDVPGMGRVSIVNAHLNARKAAMVPVARSQRAYSRQVGLMAGFVARHVPRGQTLILGGDMNIGKDGERQRAFFDAFARAGLPFVTAGLSGARQALDQGLLANSATRHDLIGAVRHGKDWLFARSGDGAALPVLAAETPFGTEAQGEPLSDHVGYAIHYAGAGRAAHEALHLAAGDPARVGRR